MGRLRKSRCSLVWLNIYVIVFTPLYIYCSEENGAQQGLLRRSLRSPNRDSAAGRIAATSSEETADKIHEIVIPEGLDARHAPEQGKPRTNAQGITSSAGTLKSQSQRISAGTDINAVGVGNNRTLPSDYQNSITKPVPPGSERTSTPDSSSKQALLQSLHSRVWNSHRVKRLNRHSEFGNALAAYAKQLMIRALTAGHEVISLLETVEGLSPDRASLLLKLLRTWPDIQELLKRYEQFKLHSQEHLLSSLVQYRARATDLATRPRPRIFASRAIQAYIDVGEPLFHDVMAAFLFSIIRDEPTQIRQFREFYLPMLQASLSASALMLHSVHSTQSRDCLAVIERRIMKLEHLGRVARAVQQTWGKLELLKSNK